MDGLHRLAVHKISGYNLTVHGSRQPCQGKLQTYFALCLRQRRPLMTTAQNNPQVAAILSSVQHSYAELTRLLNGPLAALESSKLYRQPAENEWTIMQNLAHTVDRKSTRLNS